MPIHYRKMAEIVRFHLPKQCLGVAVWKYPTKVILRKPSNNIECKRHIAIVGPTGASIEAIILVLKRPSAVTAGYLN